MIRKRILKTIGGYSDQYTMQDGYDIWLKILHRFPVGNIETPLFYYRQHGFSITTNQDKLLETRRQIIRDRAKLHSGPVKPRVISIIGAKNTYKNLPDIVLTEVGGKKLINHTLDSVHKLGDTFDKVIITTDDKKIVDFCKQFKDIECILRPKDLSDEKVTTTEIIQHVIQHLENEQKYFADILVYLNIHAPLRQAGHIQKAIDTLQLYNSDMVLSVYEDFDLHYVHAEHGLKPINEISHKQLRIEREALYVNNGAIQTMWRDVLTKNKDDKIKVGHMVMTREESFQIKSTFDLWLINEILKKKNTNEQITDDSLKLKIV